MFDDTSRDLEMPRTPKLRFVDLFAGCGGLSLGLFNAGMKGLFGIELAKDAFDTLATNLLGGGQPCYDWPAWLERRAWGIGQLLEHHEPELRRLRGTVDVVCGGPPCQGFSFYGKRERNDVRNKLVDDYIRFVLLVKPKYLLLENVRGFEVPHGKIARAQQVAKRGRPVRAFSEILFEKLSPNYVVDGCVLSSASFGVPQERERFFAIGVRKGMGFDHESESGWGRDLIFSLREQFLKDKGLPSRPITTREAIEDLETDAFRRVLEYRPEGNCRSPSGFQMINFQPEIPHNSPYIRLMRAGLSGTAPTGLRLARHSPTVRDRFATLIRRYPQGRQLNDEERAELGLRKHRVIPLAGDRPAHCITTLPDDLVHYKEPRILTVRENARLQSFPDWFDFVGKYTTGGQRRRFECPRYTQVGNAVPPLLAEAWGRTIRSLDLELQRVSRRRSPS